MRDGRLLDGYDAVHCISFYSSTNVKLHSIHCTFVVYINDCQNETARRYVCNIIKHWKKFGQGHLKRNKLLDKYMRCNDCLYCPGCNSQKYSKDFNGHSKTCTACNTLWTCKPCGQNFLADEFDATNLYNHRRNSRMDFLVCKTCRVEGYNPKDTTDYPCEICGAKGCDLFEKVELQEYKKASAVKKPKLICTTCSKAYERGKMIFVYANQHMSGVILHSLRTLKLIP